VTQIRSATLASAGGDRVELILGLKELA